MLSKKSFSRLHAVFYSRLRAAKYSLTDRIFNGNGILHKGS